LIAGVWCAEGVAAAEAILDRVTRFVGRTPSSKSSDGHFVLAYWSLGITGTLDSGRQLAWIGSMVGELTSAESSPSSLVGGDYAAIAGHDRGLRLMRGRHEGRCLYYVRLSDGVIAACSRMEPLIACLPDAKVDVETLSSLVLGEPSENLSATAFREICRVRTAETLLFASTGVHDSYQNPLTISRFDGSADELGDVVLTLLDRAIRRSINSKQRVAVLVSGGLDSSSVLARAIALARGGTKAEVDAVTWTFAGPGDDRPYLHELCASLGIVPIRVSSAEASSYAVEGLVADGAPSIWPTWSGLALAHIKARQQGAEVILTGMGGDHVFNGDPRSLAQQVQTGRVRQAVSDLSRFYEESRMRAAARLARLLLTPVVEVLPSWLRVRRRRYVSDRWPWAGRRLRILAREKYVHAPDDQEWMGATSEARFQRLITHDFLHMAETRGQMEATTGLMRSDPLLDDELVSAVAGFPQPSLLLNFRNRGLFRHAMRGRLPERLRSRSDKANFRLAIAELLERSDLSALRSLAKMRYCADLALVEPRLFEKHFEEALAARAETDDWAALWPALSVEAFLQKFSNPSFEGRG
jgi:asparagine synthetase B (glutamine-hydrolysing)